MKNITNLEVLFGALAGLVTIIALVVIRADTSPGFLSDARLLFFTLLAFICGLGITACTIAHRMTRQRVWIGATAALTAVYLLLILTTPSMQYMQPLDVVLITLALLLSGATTLIAVGDELPA